MVHIKDKLELALSFHQRRELMQAQALYQEILDAQPRHFDALHLLGVLAAQAGDHSKAVKLIDKALAVERHNAGALFNKATALQSLGLLEQALESYDAALRVNPAFVEAHSNRAVVLKELKRLAEALQSCDSALSLNADFAPAYFNRGMILHNLARHTEAIASYEKVITINPFYAEAHFNCGVVLHELGRRDAALASYEAAIAHRPNYVAAHVNRGNVLNEMQSYEAARASYEAALALKPEDALAHYNLGNIQRMLGRAEEALACYSRSLEINPRLAEALFNRGDVLFERQDYERAALSLERALALNGDIRFAAGLLMQCRLYLCDWGGFDVEVARIRDRVGRGEPASNGHCLMALSDDPALQRRAAEMWVKYKYPSTVDLPPIPPRPRRQKLRLGYVSGDFRNHPVSNLVAGLIDLHDRGKFELVAFSLGPDTNDDMRKRMERGFDHFLDVQHLSDLDVARKMRSEGIDIAIDLGGHTAGARPGIFACRAAPLQVGYLGYTGTSGASYMDYLLADETVIPAESRDHYSEKVIYLPGSYMVNDRDRLISDREFTRLQEGLLLHGFVFCCFNNGYKITPQIFDRWMRILNRVPESVLWLSQTNAAATRRLCEEAIRRGVSEQRLVFAQRLAHLPDHLARHRLAGLFLDTLPFNAHSTASDALWAGLPVLTCPGDAFASRVAASLLFAVGLQELVVATPEAYEDMAVDLASNPQRLQEIKHKLWENRLRGRLFDTQRSTRLLETAYMTIYERHRAGLSPDDVRIEDP